MNSHTPMSWIATALGSALLITWLVEGGWLIWIPVLLALAVFHGMSRDRNR
jgi:hypothetical protein